MADSVRSSFLECAMEVTKEIFLVFTKQGELLDWNCRTNQVTRYSDEEIEGMHPADFVPVEEEELVHRHIQEVLADGRTEFECHLETKEGQLLPFEFTGSRFSQDGRILICQAGRDLTSDQQTEDSTKASRLTSSEPSDETSQQGQEAQGKIRLLELKQKIASAANEADRLEEALQAAVDAVCQLTGWAVGHAYVPSQEARSRRYAERLSPISLWNREADSSYSAFRKATESISLAEGEDLLGQALASGTLSWSEDVTQDERFLRRQAAREAGLKGAFAVPVPANGETVAVLEFFSEPPGTPDDEFAEAMVSSCQQLGRVAEREQALRRLGASEERYRRLFEASQEGILLASPGGTILDANPALCEITGYTGKELKGSQASSLYGQEAREELIQGLREEGRVRGLEVTVHHKEGEERICLVSATAWTDGEGKIQAIQSFVRDITKRKKTEQALEESEEKFRDLAENALVGISLVQEGTFQYVNPALAQISEYSREEIVGKSPEAFIHPGDWPKVQEHIQKRIAGEADEVRYEARARTKSGEMRYGEVAGCRITYQGKPAVIATVQDVTEQRRMKREILRIQEEERRRLGQDLHDGVAAQLTGVTMLLDALKAKAEEQCPKLSPRVQRVLELVQESNEDLRRVSRGLNPVVLQDRGLRDALERLAENTTGCSLTVDGNIEHQATLSDEKERQLYWIAQEAVANAKQHGRAKTIAIRLRREEDALVLEVQDDGRGFDPQGMETEGLGLRSMQHRAELMGAKLRIDSSPGEGTVVRCRLAI